MNINFRKFFSRDDGGILIIAAIALIPLLVFAGFSVDIGRAYHARTLLASATDAAAIAAAKASKGQERADAERIFGAYLKNTSLDGKASITYFNQDAEKHTITIKSSSDVDMNLLRIVGKDKLNVGGSSSIFYGDTILEVALVLDNTGSMNGFVSGKRKIDILKEASHLFLDIVFNGESLPQNLFVSIVPYITQVNAGPYDSWLTVAGKALINHSGFYPPSPKHDPWYGCFEARLNNGLHLTDTPPTDESTRFNPYFWPSTKIHKYPYPDGKVKPWAKGSGDNDWDNGNVTDPSSNNPLGPNAGCPVQTLALTNKKSDLDKKVDEMFPIGRGGTFIFEGLKWGWRTLSSKWQGLWFNDTGQVLPKKNGDSKKIIILMTDGQNEWIGFNEPYNTYRDMNYTAYGRWYNALAHVALNQKIITPGTMNDYTLTMCDSIKNDPAKYELYTIAFGPVSSTSKAMMKACASSSGHYFEANSASKLTGAFQEIGKRIRNLRFTWQEG